MTLATQLTQNMLFAPTASMVSETVQRLGYRMTSSREDTGAKKKIWQKFKPDRNFAHERLTH